MSKTLLLLGFLVGAGGGASCWDELDAGEAAVVRIGELELIGISGRRLLDGESYRVPLDSQRLVSIGASTREAMVIVNRGPRTAVIEALAISDGGDEWKLVAPIRARESPLCAARRALEPDARIDFDVSLRAHEAGLREAWLDLAWSVDGVIRTRRILLQANAVDTRSATGSVP